MKCPACQTELPNEAKFCNVCGQKLELDCPECHKSNPSGSKFCLACGQKLAKGPPRGKAEAIADAERKQVTALFSDISGYTAMTEKLDPEDVKEITSRIFDGVRAVVVKYDGFIERFAGDGVLALFGVPTSHEDDPIRAIRAAREIHELVEAMNPEYEDKVGAPLSMHSGINTGLSVTADVNPDKGTHGVTGDAINIAARLSDRAKAGDILIGSLTYRQAEGHFTFETLEPTKVKGKSEPVSIFKVLSLKEQPVKTHGLSGLRAELTGRKAELARLLDAAERLKERKGSVIAICGDAGTGKSRLVEEFKASLDPGKIRWREGHAYPYAQNIPYFPLMDLMNRAWRIQEGDRPDQVREKIESGVERLLGTREDVAPYIGTLYSLSYPAIEEVSPEFWKSRLFDGVKRIVAALTEHAPTIFCFEDIHWADPSTLDLLRFLVSDSKYSALFVCVHRLPFSLFSTHQLSALGHLYEEISLQDLSPSDTLDMVASLLRSDGIPGQLKRFIQDKVEGNPFYVEEAINSLIESGILASDNGTWKLTSPLGKAGIPPTVQGVIASRLDRLEKDMKRTLQEASVIGRAFLREILTRITALQDSMDQSLQELVMRDLVRVRSLQPDLEYVFKHALTQEVVYNGLLKKERQEIHERIALVMEEVFQDRLSEFCEALAFHFKQGRSLIKAVKYLMKSGQKSLNKFAVDESHEYYREAYQLLANREDMDKEERELFIDLLIEWGSVIYYRGGFDGYEDILAAHEELAISLKDKARLGMFLAWFGWAKFWRAKHKEARCILENSLKIGEEIQNPQVIGYASCWLAFVYPELGFLNTAIAMGERALTVARAVPSDQYLNSKPLTALGMAHTLTGDGYKVLRKAQQLLELGRRYENVRSTAMGHVVAGFGHWTNGDFLLAIESCQKAVETTTDPLYRRYALFGLSFSYAANKQFTFAQVAAQEVVDFSNEAGTETLGKYCEIVLALASIVKGHMTQGVEQLRDLSRAFSVDGKKPALAITELALGSLYLQIAQGEGDLSRSTIFKNIGFLIKNVPFAAKKAEAHFNKAIEVAQEIGARGVLGQAYLDLGRLHKAKKRKDKARECITKAIEYFELCEAGTYLKQARKELESLGQER